MEVNHRQLGGVAVVEVKGKLVGGPEECALLHGVVQSLLEEGKRRFVVDLTETPWVSSLGIGMLIGAYTSIKNAGGQLVLANASDRITGVLSVTKLDLIFRVFYTLDDAVAHLVTSTTRPTTGPRVETAMLL